MLQSQAINTGSQQTPLHATKRGVRPSQGAPPQPAALLRAQTRKRGLRLLDQQCWCWGYDIKRPEGNLLLEYGFVRERPPAGILGSSAYHLRLDSARQLIVWGFGLVYQEDSQAAIMLGRSTFLPLLLKETAALGQVWSPDALPPSSLPETEHERAHARRLLAQAIRQIAVYEGWVIARLGLAYREQCLQSWRQKYLPAPEAIAAWLTIAEACEQD